jgi:hypothetical protein
MDANDFWRNTIDGIDDQLSLPSDGQGPPDIEKIVPKKKGGLNKNRKVMVQRIVTQVYLFTDTKGKSFSSKSSQNLQILGEMTLEQALKLANEEE